MFDLTFPRQRSFDFWKDDFVEPFKFFEVFPAKIEETKSAHIEQTKNRLSIAVLMPGINKEKLNVSVENGQLVLDYDVPEKLTPLQYTLKHQAVKIPAKFLSAEPRASYENGILTVQFEIEQEKTIKKRIEVH